MRTRWLNILTAFTVLIMLLNPGCKATSISGTANPLVGKWICHDLSEMEHISHFKALTMEFKSTGEFESFYVANDGTRTRVEQDGESPRWCAANGVLTVGDASPIGYEVSGMKLRLILADNDYYQLSLHLTRE